MAEIHTEHIVTHKVAISARRWLSEHTFELRLEKPVGFVYLPGQKILCILNQEKREYTLVGSPDDNDLAICVKRISRGSFSSCLAEIEVGEEISISESYGFFIHQKGDSVFVATGTGVAPFVAYARSGVRGFILLHGVSSEKELYYDKLLADAAKKYVPCLSSASRNLVCGTFYEGRVTEYLLKTLAPGRYNFYLCGNGIMIRDAIKIIDRKFPDSKVFHETFFL